MDIKKWILTWFVRNTDFEIDEIEKNLNEDYLLKGWIDSLKFITFISDMESKFNIIFSNDEFQNNSFSTINGIVKIIEEKMNG